MNKTKKDFKGRGKKNNYTKRANKGATSSTKDILVDENDIGWYTRYPKLTGPAGSIIFNHRYGVSEDTTAPVSAVVNGNSATSVPGIFVAKFWPMYADGADVASAVNVASKNIYTYLRHANSGSVNYESSDLMQYLITVMNLYTRLEEAKRLVRLVMSYSPINKYTGKDVATALYGAYSYSQVITNPARLVSYINVLAAKLNTFKIPKDIAILDRHLWMVSNIFRDDELNKYSVYAFKNHLNAHYDWANQEVQLVDVASINNYNINTELTAIDAEINNLLNYEDIGIMIGDMLKAYKTEGCRIVSPMDLGEIIEPAYSAEVLDQFRNITIVYPQTSTLYTDKGYEIKQLSSNTQVLYYHQNGTNTDTDGVYHGKIFPVGTGNSGDVVQYQPILTIDKDDPTSDDVLLSTRLSLCMEVDTGSELATVANYGTEIIISGAIYYYEGDLKVPGSADTLSYQDLYTFILIGNFNDVATCLDDLHGVLFATNQAHKMTGTPNYTVYMDFNQSGDQCTFITNYYRGKNVTELPKEVLKRLHEVCKLSEYSMPMFKLLES